MGKRRQRGLEAELLWMADGSGRALGKRANATGLGGWRSEKSSSWGSGGSGGCGKAELLWMADGSGRAQGWGGLCNEKQ